MIKVKPYLADPYFFRGLAKFYLEDYSGAEADCTMAIDRNPFVVDAYEVRALSRLQTGKYLDAVKDYDKGLEFLPENKVFMLNKAIALQNAGVFGDSHAAYDELLQKFPIIPLLPQLQSQVSVFTGSGFFEPQLLQKLPTIPF